MAKWTDTVTLDEEKGEIAFMEEGHDVERVVATHKNPHRYEMYRRNVRDRLRVEIGVKTTALSMMKLAERLNVINYEVVYHFVTCARDELRRAVRRFSLGRLPDVS